MCVCVCVCVCVRLNSKVCVKIAQSCPTLHYPMEYTVYGILQARILEWVAFPFSRGSSQPRDWTHVSYIEGGFFTSWATREAQEYWSVPSPADLPDPGIRLGFPALEVDSLPTKLLGIGSYDYRGWWVPRSAVYKTQDGIVPVLRLQTQRKLMFQFKSWGRKELPKSG